MPLDLCEVYGGGCHGCLMSRDPYCGWDQDHCTSIYSSQRYIAWGSLALGEGGHGSGGGVEGLQEILLWGHFGQTLLFAHTVLGVRIGQGLAAASRLSLSSSNSRSVLQSMNPMEPHKECPNPKPGT